MAVKIRLAKFGKKKKPCYRIVVANDQSPRDGRFIERLGYYDPHWDPIKLFIKKEKAEAWLGKGAVPSDTVKSLFKQAGIKC